MSKKRIMVFGDGMNLVADIDKVNQMGFQKKIGIPADEAKAPEFFITVNGITHTKISKILVGTDGLTIKYEPVNFEKLVEDYLIDTFTPAE